MDGFRVEPGALEQAATAVAEGLRGRDGATLRGLCGAAERYGHAGVHEALLALCARWDGGLDLLATDGAAITSGLRRAAARYRAADERLANGLAAGG